MDFMVASTVQDTAGRHTISLVGDNGEAAILYTSQRMDVGTSVSLTVSVVGPKKAVPAKEEHASSQDAAAE